MSSISKITLLTIIIIVLCLFNFFMHDQEDFERYKQLPPEQRNHPLSLNYFRVTEINKDYFAASKRSDHLSAFDYRQHLQETRPLRVGDYVSLEGSFIGGDAVRITRLHIHKGRNLKRVIAVPIVVFIFAFFFSAVKLFFFLAFKKHRSGLQYAPS